MLYKISARFLIEGIRNDDTLSELGEIASGSKLRVRNGSFIEPHSEKEYPYKNATKSYNEAAITLEMDEIPPSFKDKFELIS